MGSSNRFRSLGEDKLILDNLHDLEVFALLGVRPSRSLLFAVLPATDNS